MDIDLLFTALKQSEWKNVSALDTLESTFFEQGKGIISFEGNEAEKILNTYFEGEQAILIIVLDPLRIQAPIKKIKKDGFQFVEIQGTVSVDAVIDKIKLKADKNGQFSMNVKHFD